MNIKTLKIFSDLVDNANFSKTAKKNGVSQSAISQKIKLLEERLNVNLLEKKQKAFQLTQEGIVFYKHAQVILSEYEAMIEDLQNYDPKNSSGINLLTSYWIGIYIIPHFIREYLKISLNFDLDINYSDYHRIQGANFDPRSDLIILEFPLNNEELVSEQFTEDEFVAVCLERSVPKDQQMFSLSNLKSFPLIGFAKNHPLRSIFESTIEKKIGRLIYFMEFNQIDLMKQAIEIHNGIAILPKSSVCSIHDEQIFKVMPLKDIRIPISLYIIYRKNRKMNCAMECFIQVLKGKSLICYT